MTEEQRADFQSALQDNERDCAVTSSLCGQTLHMLTYLTSDEVIKVPFLSAEILPRFVSMLLNILNRLVGPKSLEIKVENVEQYNFQPKELLQDVCMCLLHFADQPSFHEAIAKDGFYEGGVPLRKAIATVNKMVLNRSVSAISVEHVASLKDLEAEVA